MNRRTLEQRIAWLEREQAATFELRRAVLEINDARARLVAAERRLIALTAQDALRRERDAKRVK